jgi:hypothetical protein
MWDIIREKGTGSAFHESEVGQTVSTIHLGYGARGGEVEAPAAISGLYRSGGPLLTFPVNQL